MCAAADQTALGIDIGGTRVRVGIVSARGKTLASVEDRLPPEGDPDRLGALITGQARRVRDQTGHNATTVGVALPGVWDPDTGVMKKAVNLPKLEGVSLPDLFRRATGHPVRLEADVNAAAWGQWRSMRPQPQRLVYVSLGTGVGGAVVLDGQLIRHTRGGAGHFGFLIVDTSPGAPAGRNGVPGCLSAIAAGPALHLASTGTTNHEAIGEEPFPPAVLERAAKVLVVAFMNLAHLFAPDAIALGGGVIDNHPEIAAHARAAFSRCQSPLIPPGMRIEQAPLSTHEAGVIGAALMALEST